MSIRQTEPSRGSLSRDNTGRGSGEDLVLSPGLRQERHEAERSPPEDSDPASEGEIAEREFHLGGGVSLGVLQKFVLGQDAGSVPFERIQDAVMEGGGRPAPKGRPTQVYHLDPSDSR